MSDTTVPRMPTHEEWKTVTGLAVAFVTPCEARIDYPPESTTGTRCELRLDHEGEHRATLNMTLRWPR